MYTVLGHKPTTSVGMKQSVYFSNLAFNNILVELCSIQFCKISYKMVRTVIGFDYNM